MEKEIIMFMLLDELSKYNIPKNQITVIKKHIDNLNMDSLKNHKVNDIIYIIKHFFSRRFASKENLDVKEYLYMDMGNIPEHNSVEIANEFSLQELLENPKRIEKTDRLYASYRNAANNSISVFTSARLTATFALASYAANVTPGSSPLISIATTEAEGTILYYSIE